MSIENQRHPRVFVIIHRVEDMILPPGKVVRKANEPDTTIFLADREVDEAGDHTIKDPPLLSIQAPVMLTAASETRNPITAACSSGVAHFLRGMADATTSISSAEVDLVIIGVSVAPGQKALTRSPLGPNSRAMWRDSPTRACLAAV